MALLSAASLRAGGTLATAAYLGGTLVWPAGARAKTATLTDTFDTLDAAKWSTASPSTIRATGGRLEFDNNPDYSSYLFAVGTYDLRESSMSVQVIQTPGTAEYSGCEFGYQLTAGTSVALDIETGGGVNRLVLYTSGGVTAGQVTYNAADMAWLRLRASGATVYGDTSPNGTTWTQRFAITPPFAIDAIQPYMGCGGDVAQGKFVVDNFNVLPAPAASVARVDSARVDTAVLG